MNLCFHSGFPAQAKSFRFFFLFFFLGSVRYSEVEKQSKETWGLKDNQQVIVCAERKWPYNRKSFIKLAFLRNVSVGCRYWANGNSPKQSAFQWNNIECLLSRRTSINKCLNKPHKLVKSVTVSMLLYSDAHLYKLMVNSVVLSSPSKTSLQTELSLLSIGCLCGNHCNQTISNHEDLLSLNRKAFDGRGGRCILRGGRCSSVRHSAPHKSVVDNNTSAFQIWSIASASPPLCQLRAGDLTSLDSTSNPCGVTKWMPAHTLVFMWRRAEVEMNRVGGWRKKKHTHMESFSYRVWCPRVTLLEVECFPIE